jgi:putative radical SAM enzyme (TIGR03279 family)
LINKSGDNTVVEVVNIEANSTSQDLGLQIGDKVLKVNGKEITDALDYRFYITADQVNLLVQRGNEKLIYEIEKEYDDDLGLELEDLEMRSCGNKCIFCFVFQNPKGLRKPLYFKDEDYRFSFLYGHYTTLTNATQADLDRIVEQKLSPLYISVHATEPELRKLMLGINFNDHLFEKFDFLTKNGIELNCQIVLCPGLNDESYLEQTINDLKSYYPMVKSIAIVPVGLTKHRKNLYPINAVTKEYGLKTIAEIEGKRKLLRKELGSYFVYLSDEFYIRTNTPIPGNDYYEDFYQLENGVGLSRDLMNTFEEEYLKLKNHIFSPAKFSLITGVLGSQVLEKYFIKKLNELPNLNFEIHTILNQFYGSSITVSGLLVGQDINNQLTDKSLGDYVVLPPRCLNDNGVFLDNWTFQQLEEKLNHKLFVFPGSFVKLFEKIDEYEVAFSNYSR